MTAQSVEFPLVCQVCGTPGVAWKGQTLRRGELRWEVDFQCENCGLTSCDWDTGEAPTHIREALLSAYGPAWLRVEEARDRVKALQVLRRTFGWSLEHARQALAGLASPGYECTDVEAEFLRLELKELGVLAAVVK
ncbi:hypothetical protein [Kitasatospora sp. NPDC050543]|uniref:hypothetical protein n=1 Tax=Kitasatospora sp. NPDC050543 TaxID=3364054 RepID=UPI0037BD20AB